MGGPFNLNDYAFYQETPSSVKKSTQTLFKERELRIKEFTEMNEKLNQMKEQFKREMMRSAKVKMMQEAEEIDQ